MKPLPKWLGIVSAVATFIGAVDKAQLDALVGPTAAGIAIGLAGFVTLLCHSLTGTAPITGR